MNSCAFRASEVRTRQRSPDNDTTELLPDEQSVAKINRLESASPIRRNNLLTAPPGAAPPPTPTPTVGPTSAQQPVRSSQKPQPTPPMISPLPPLQPPPPPVGVTLSSLEAYPEDSTSLPIPNPKPPRATEPAAVADYRVVIPQVSFLTKNLVPNWASAITAVIKGYKDRDDTGRNIAAQVLLRCPAILLPQTSKRAGDKTIPILTIKEIASAVLPPRRELKSRTPEERLINRAVSLAIQGQLGRAVNAMMRDLDVPELGEEEKLKLLTALHPKRVEDVKKCLPEGPVELKLRPQKKAATSGEPQLKAVIRRWCGGKAAGPSGWTEELICDAITVDTAGDWMALFEDIVNASLDTTTLQHLRRCNLLGIPKKPTGIRPLAMGETLVKVAVKLLLSTQKELFDSKAVGSFQYAFEKCGVEQIIHQVRELIRDPAEKPANPIATPDSSQPLLRQPADNDNATPPSAAQSQASPSQPPPRQHAVLVDCTNAFNTIRRQAIGEALMSDPKFNPLRQLFNAFYVEQGELIIRSDTGDSPVISSSEGVRQGDVLGPLFFCLALKPAIENTIHRFRTVVESLPVPKFFAYMDDVTIVGEENACIAALDYLQEELSKLSLMVNAKKTVTTSAVLAQSLKCEHSDCFKLLGAFVGRAVLKEKARIDEEPKKHEKLFNRLPFLPAEIAYRLLIKCGVPRFGHLIRTHEPDVVKPAAEAFTEMSVRCLANILRVDYNHMDKEGFRQIRLPVRHGGLGVLDWSEMAEAAYAASLNNESKNMDDEDAQWLPTDAETREDTMWENQLEALKVENKQFSDHISRNATKMASRWLLGDITVASSQPSNAFRAAMLFRIRWAGARPNEQARVKCRCGFPRTNVLTTTTRDLVMHMAGCAQSGGPTKRHHFVRDALAVLMTRAGYSVQTEVVLDPKAELRMDIVATPPEGPTLYIDTTVANSTSRTFKDKAEETIFALKDAEKKAKYDAHVKSLKGTYMTFALDIYGKTSKETINFLNGLKTQIKVRCVDMPSQDAITYAATITHLSKALAFGNGTCLLYSQQLPQIGINLGAAPVTITAPSRTVQAPSTIASPQSNNNTIVPAGAPAPSAPSQATDAPAPTQPCPDEDPDSYDDETPFEPPGSVEHTPEDDQPHPHPDEESPPQDDLAQLADDYQPPEESSLLEPNDTPSVSDVTTPSYPTVVSGVNDAFAPQTQQSTSTKTTAVVAEPRHGPYGFGFPAKNLQPQELQPPSPPPSEGSRYSQFFDALPNHWGRPQSSQGQATSAATAQPTPQEMLAQRRRK
eukprot:GILI01000749.1.p1 GENE.GILI01000749.1~~GILI01000749.1.p1  ORF type:complete len:1357 (+),score=316.40 GILI01000749.1:219-4073(+)